MRIPLEMIKTVPATLAAGNSKLGPSIYSWSLPASLTCPGKTKLCESLCYALKYRFAGPSILRKAFYNWFLASTPFFAWWTVRKINQVKARVVRIHASGDFFSAAYVRQWSRIAGALPLVRFYAYTRSWRIPEIRPALVEFAQLPNTQLWYSTDAETGDPVLASQESAVRTAYLATHPNDVPAVADLIFRDYPSRGIVQKHVGGTLVCPTENGTGKHIQCSRCAICYTDPSENPAKRTSGRFGQLRRTTGTRSVSCL